MEEGVISIWNWGGMGMVWGACEVVTVENWFGRLGGR